MVSDAGPIPGKHATVRTATRAAGGPAGLSGAADRGHITAAPEFGDDSYYSRASAGTNFAASIVPQPLARSNPGSAV